MSNRNRYGTRLLLAAGCLLGSAADAGTAEAPSSAELVERLLSVADRVPVLPEVDATTRRTFLFDAVQPLEPADVFRAAAFVLEQNPPPEAESERAAYQRAMAAKLQVLFEYYPIVAAAPADAQRLVDAIKNGTNLPVLRRFLIRRSAPGLAGRSVLGDYLQGMLAGDPEFDRVLSEIVRNSTERQEVQLAAMDALVARIGAAYASLLAADPVAAKEGAAPTIQAVKEAPDAYDLSARTRKQIEQQSEKAQRFAAMLVNVTRDTTRAPAVRQQARAAVKQLIHKYPLPDAAALTARMEEGQTKAADETEPEEAVPAANAPEKAKTPEAE